MRLAFAPAVALLALGCSAEIDSYTADAESGSTHALVSVERTEVLEGGERAQALATFMHLPADADARGVMESVGIAVALPNVGQCVRDNEPSGAYRGSVELISAGDVQLSTTDSTVGLAPHAFPTVTDVVSGLVYATRDQAAEPFPTGTNYTFKVDGELGAFSVTRPAPDALTAITVGGVPLSEAGALSASAPMDLTWSVGSPGDVLWVEVASAGGSTITCAFRDDLGAATLNADLLHGGTARLSLHRLRRAEFQAPGLARGEIRFDFAVSASVTFTP
ncbi:MAG: hypothetical protein R3B13_38455 [Polyangiaceae bacterium]